MDVVVLVLLLLQSALGVLALLRWRKALRPSARFPTSLVAAHIAVSDIATILWVVRLVTDEVGWGWAALGVLLVGNGIGDLVLAGRWRLDQATSGAWLKGWVSAAKGLTNPKRRVGAAHAAGAGITTVALLVACLIG
ncbi:hypothetical protein ACFQ0K_00870 [Nocardioides caeni]|uniref:Uncharacterized protein n=1 Tax=Nocardioides caeni TaxID=574700 RepID=A0A4S8NR55_9ACTN|nr:hypothetical protein [Nocardioides caeni]THV18572.1 hypothetical protein E9934_02880 [Nocardioides caeni]